MWSRQGGGGVGRVGRSGGGVGGVGWCSSGIGGHWGAVSHGSSVGGGICWRSGISGHRRGDEASLGGGDAEGQADKELDEEQEVSFSG